MFSIAVELAMAFTVVLGQCPLVVWHLLLLEICVDYTVLQRRKSVCALTLIAPVRF